MNADAYFRRSTVASSDVGCRECGQQHVVTEATARELMEKAIRFAVFQRQGRLAIDAHEVASIVVERYLRLIGTGRACPETWSDAYLHVVVRNTVRDLYRREMRQQSVEVPWSEGLEESLATAHEEDPIGVEMKDLLARLPPQLRAIVVLTAAGFSIRQISEQLELPRTSCHRDLNIAREKLRRIIAQERSAETSQLGD